MNTKILKYELLGLFTLTLTTLIVFYYRDGMPDNYLSISSSTNYGFFSYYTYSLMNFINYYTGPWLFIPCAIFTACYARFYSKRADLIDTFNIVTVLGATFSFVHLASPSLIGAGLNQFVASFFSPIVIGFGFILMSALFLWGTFRNRFIEAMIEFKALMFNLKEKAQSAQINEKLLALKDKIAQQKAEKHMAIEDMSSSFKIPFVGKQKNELAEENLEKEDVSEEFSKEASSENSSLKLKEELEDTNNEKVVLSLAAPEVVEEKSEENSEEMTEKKMGILPLLNTKTMYEKVEDFEEVIVVKEAVVADSDNEYVDESEISTYHNPVKQDSFDEDQYYGLVKHAATSRGEHPSHQPEDKYFHDIIYKIETKLAEFKITGQIINVLKGPVVDTFEWELGAGEKVSRLTSIAEDLSLALSGSPIRMVYPMKGRTTVGIEVPRNPRDFIFLDEIITAKDFSSTSHILPLAMGKDAFGEPVVVDLASMPHMLVAGSTGAGKSVFINSVLVSLLIKKSPNHMKLILIDPKQLELALYARLPHLIMPVITEAKTAATALLWACQEMERRYSIMSEFGVRNIEGFNHKLKTASKENTEKLRKYYEYETEDTYELPYIVVIVDEFADLILTQKGKEIETHICRLAAKARAAGIHLMLATQRPSVDVITGLIKSNFPTRVSFRVTSSTDSRTILNAMGAEKLLGKGDMLYKQGVDTTRIHSAFIDEGEIEQLTDKLSEMAPSFNPTVMEFLENGGEEEPVSASGRNDSEQGGLGSKDEKYDEAVKVVMEHRSASASLLQRRLGVGYNRAANLIDELEANGVIGPAQGSKPRKVLGGTDASL